MTSNDYQVTLDPEKGYSSHNYRSFFRGELPGLSVFIRTNDEILHSYSTYLRGLDVFLPMYHLLDELHSAGKTVNTRMSSDELDERANQRHRGPRLYCRKQ